MTPERAEWLAWRREGIGASDVAGILGVSPWASPYSIWFSKVTEPDDDDNATEAMEFGLRAEPMLAAWFADRHPGLWIAGEQTRCTHPDLPWMRCTVDGFVVDHDDTPIGDALGVYETKTTGDTTAEWEAGIPEHYRLQAHWSMAVTGLDRVWFGVLHLAFGRPKFRTYLFERDQEAVTRLVSHCGAFWEQYVLTGTPPPIDAHEATTAVLKRQWPDPEGIVEADERARELVEQHLYFAAERKAIDDTLETVDNQLRAALGERTDLVDGTDRGKPNVIASWRPQESSRLDVDALRRAWPDLVRDFERTTTTRFLRVKTKGKR